jgi:hypothetical protein
MGCLSRHEPIEYSRPIKESLTNGPKNCFRLPRRLLVPTPLRCAGIDSGEPTATWTPFLACYWHATPFNTNITLKWHARKSHCRKILWRFLIVFQYSLLSLWRRKNSHLYTRELGWRKHALFYERYGCREWCAYCINVLPHPPKKKTRLKLEK